jgi:hypothetical protein
MRDHDTTVPAEYAALHTSRELLIASLLIAGALVFYAPVVKISPANTPVCTGSNNYPRRTTLLCTGDNSRTTGASTENASGISLGGPTPYGPAPVHCYPDEKIRDASVIRGLTTGSHTLMRRG